VLLASADLLHVDAEWLDQLAVLHAGRTRGFARPAIEAEIDVPLHLLVQLDPPIGHGAHEVDAAARAVVLISQLDVGWTRRRTQAAMDAVEKQLVINPRIMMRGLGFILHSSSFILPSDPFDKPPRIEDSARIELLFDNPHQP